MQKFLIATLLAWEMYFLFYFVLIGRYETTKLFYTGPLTLWFGLGIGLFVSIMLFIRETLEKKWSFANSLVAKLLFYEMIGAYTAIQFAFVMWFYEEAWWVFFTTKVFFFVQIPTLPAAFGVYALIKMFFNEPAEKRRSL